MTADNFTGAAHSEAEALVDDIVRWDDTIATDGPCDGTWDSLAEYLAGRGWVRTHLAAQETADGGYGTRSTEAVRGWTGAWPAAQEPIDAAVRKAKAEAWDEGYRLGVADAHTSADWTGGEIPPGRVNPHRPYPWKIGETDG